MSFWGSLFGTDTTGRDAAAKQSAAEQAAIAQQRQAGTQAQTDYTGLAGQYQPYQAGGLDAYNMLLSGAGLGGDPNAYRNAYTSTPGYQEGLQTGQQAAERGIAASGHGLGSGGALKALTRYGIGYNNQQEGNYWNKLMGLNNQGFQATGQNVATQGAGIGANLGAQTNAYQGAFKNAATIPQGEIADATASNQAWTNLLGAGATLGGAALGGGYGAKAGTGLWNMATNGFTPSKAFG